MACFARARRWIAPAVIALMCCVHAQRACARGTSTHFLAELDAGATLSGSGGPAASIALGAGGKLECLPPRFYVIGTFAASTYTASSSAAQSPWPATENGRFADLALGPRVYVPVLGVRWFGEALLGASHASATYDEAGLSTELVADEWLVLAMVATGVQWRLLPALSIGLRVAFSFNEAGLIGVARLAGVHDTARTSIGLGAAWQF